MVLSRGFAGFMGLVVLFLLFTFATEDTRCVARARRAIERYLSAAIPASVASLDHAEGGEPPVTFALAGHAGWTPEPGVCASY